MGIKFPTGNFIIKKRAPDSGCAFFVKIFRGTASVPLTVLGSFSIGIERWVDKPRLTGENNESKGRIASAWEVDERTIKRDVEFLRDRLMLPIEYDRQRRGYCYKEPTWGIPAVFIREKELPALQLAIEQSTELPMRDVLSQFFVRLLKVMRDQT